MNLFQALEAVYNDPTLYLYSIDNKYILYYDEFQDTISLRLLEAKRANILEVRMVSKFLHKYADLEFIKG